MLTDDDEYTFSKAKVITRIVMGYLMAVFALGSCAPRHKQAELSTWLEAGAIIFITGLVLAIMVWTATPDKKPPSGPSGCGS